MVADFREILDHIDPAPLPYEDWLAVGMAIKHEGGTAQDWDQWSQRDTKRYKPGECERKWHGFNGSASPVTAGTLVELAKQNGWTPSRTSGRDEAYDWDTTTIYSPAESLKVLDPTWVEPAEMAVPSDLDWHPARELATYLSALFESHEHVGYVVTSWTNEDGKHLPQKGSYNRTAGELLEELGKYGDDLSLTLGSYDPNVGAWIRFNPLDGRGVRDENVTAFRYALVESDTLAVDKQAAIYAELELPIAALVHSGGKSLHAIVRIGATSKEEYRERVNFLHRVCQKNGLQIDTANKNPSRLSRMPGVTRNGQKQYLVATNQGKESWEAWREYIEQANDNLPDFEPLESVFHDLPKLAEPLIDGVLREGHKMLLSGPSKAGKSYMLLQLTLAIAEGRTWLGWPCRQGRVLYVNLELDRASCLHRIADLYKRLDWVPSNLANIDLWNLRGKAVPMDALAPKLIRRAAKRHYKAIIIDPIYKVITGDENAADKMAFFCNQFDRVCAELGAAVIYCHHHSKGSQGQKSARDRASGSGVFARDPDAILDIIELLIPEATRKAMADRAVCDMLAMLLDAKKPDWRDEVSQDDALIATKMLEAAKGIPDADSRARALRTKLKSATGWRLECTLREFAPLKPHCFWFQHPLHVVDTGGFLTDTKADGEAPPWAAEREKQKADQEKKRSKLIQKYEFMAFETGAVPIDELAAALEVEPDKAKRGLSKAGLALCDDGMVRTKIDALAYQKQQKADELAERNTRISDAVREATALADDGIPRIGTVHELLGIGSIVTTRKWVREHPLYTLEDGKVLPREGRS